MSSGSGCLSCTDPIPLCSCPSGQSCQLVQRTCNQCSYNECYDSTSSSSSSGGSNIGTSVGGALGGVAAIAAALGLVYWFWWKPRGLAASRRRYSKHLSHRASKMVPPTTTADKKLGSPPGGVTKPSSVHLNIGTAGDATLSRRAGSPGPGAGRGETPSLPASVGATGGHSTRTSIDSDNPFGDHARSSIGTFASYPDDASTRTSDFSFRSSHSTNIIPIAYIPPHSNSLSVDDANRGAYGEVLSPGAESSPSRSSVGRAPTRSSVPTSMASRDSLALAGGELIDLHPLPPALSPGSPVIPFGASAHGGAPIRPPRSPGLDLQLPQGSSASPLSSPSARDSRLGGTLRPTSGFPFTGPPSSTTTPSFLSTAPADRGMSILLDPRSSTSATSHLSTISSSTSRSAGSTMSYILDPPQIITPVNAQGLRRVEVMGRGQAGLIKISGSGGGSLPGSPAVDGVHPPSSQDGTTSPTTPKAFGGQSMIAQQQATAADPFSDLHATSRFSVGGIAAPNSSPPNNNNDDRRASHSTITSSSSPSLDHSNSSPSSRWTTSSLASSSRRGSGESVNIEIDPLHPSSLATRGSFDVPSSARSSEAYSLRSAVSGDEEGEGDTGRRSRRLTGESGWTESSERRRDSGSTINGGGEGGSPRQSFVSSRSGGTDSMSMLDGIPFMGPTTTSSATAPRFSTNSASTVDSSQTDEEGTIIQAPRSPLFPMPPPRSPSFVSTNGGMPSPALPSSSAAAEPALGLGLADASTSGAQAEEEEDDPLPLPFLPFAGQRPTTSLPSHPSSTFGDDSNRDSQAISLRSGFVSGLSDVAFRLDGGLRDSMFSEAGGAGPSSERGSVMGGGGGEGRYLEGVEEGQEGASRPTSYASTLGSGEEEEEEEEEEAIIVTSAVRAPIARSTSIKRSAPSSPLPPSSSSSPPTQAAAESDPFGDQAAVVPPPLANAAATEERDDPRSSMDSLALSAALGRSWEGED